MDLLAIDVTDVSDPTAARGGKMVTLIGPEISIDDLAAASKSTGREVLSHLAAVSTASTTPPKQFELP